MPRVRRYFAMLGVLLLPSLLSAQTLVDDVPPEYEEPVEVWASPEEIQASPFHKQRLLEEEYAELLGRGRIVSVISLLVAQFEARDWSENKDKQQKILNRLQLFLGAVNLSLQTPSIEGVLDKRAEQNIFLDALNNQNFGLHSLKIEPVMDSGGNMVSGYFDGTDRNSSSGSADNNLVLYEYV